MSRLLSTRPGLSFLERRRAIAAGWFRASAGEVRFHAPFTAAANEAFDAGGCFSLASLMQGLERSATPELSAPSKRAALVWGPRDRTHRHSNPDAACPGAEVVRFEACGHSPELEDPEGFARWLLAWHERAS